MRENSSSEWDVEVFTDECGWAPLLDWLSALDFTIQSRILDRFNRLRHGNFGDHKSLQGGLSELRFHFGAGYRVYYGSVDNRIVLLLCGGDKGSQAKDIKKAQGFWKKYKESLL